MYFHINQIKEFFLNLSKRFNKSKILFDATSTWMCKNSHKHDTIKNTDSPFKLALDDDRTIESWADNLKFENVFYFSDFNDWKRAGLFYYWIMKLVPKIRTASRMLIYNLE
eukprot:gnl/Chilomastix_cuspidata/12807.p1 GENE.gnl/Chilomastix_cuspidata/12807~~gnl/Chilomastix_cuspidata/12807.p1  ORF type:complete len:129 (+),score=14.28 gnl/Chilomastix_cuspidata/12807:57-389(+)